MIARTFSKIQGMAGLRVGYVVAQPETLEIIQRVTRGGMGITLAIGSCGNGEYGRHCVFRTSLEN